MLTIEIDKKALIHNAVLLRSAVNSLCAVVKADAYGHGLIEVAREIEDLADYFAVGFASEALTLRQNGIKKPIIILGALEYDLLHELSSNDITVTAHCFEDIFALLKLNRSIKLHIKTDCGMHRLGFDQIELATALRMLKNCKKIEVTGIYTHFSDAVARSNIRQGQHEQFLKAKNISGQGIAHCGASAVALNESKMCHSMVRCGIALYGYYPYYLGQGELKRVLSAHSNLSQLKWFRAGDRIGYEPAYECSVNTLVGVVACGYGDGIKRSLANNGRVCIDGRLYNIIGMICMDMFMVDLEGNQSIKNGQRVDIISDCYDAWDMAHDSKTIAYEVLTGFTARAKRIYR